MYNKYWTSAIQTLKTFQTENDFLKQEQVWDPQMSRNHTLKCYFAELLRKNIEKGNSELWKEHEKCVGEEYKTGYF